LRTSVRHFSDATWAALIGVAHYTSSDLQDLGSPADDAAALADALARSDGCAVPHEQIILAGNAGAVSKQEAVDALAALVTATSPDSTVIVYFAGHGVATGEDFALCCSDTQFTNLEETALTGNTLSGLLGSIRARGILVILDCCQGAGFAERAPSFFRTLESGDFRILLSSTRVNEQSWELPDGKGTLFTSLLLRIVRGEESVGDTPGLVYFSELLSFIQDQLNEELEVKRLQNLRQTPVFAGVYPRDPLLFVHRLLTLDQLAVRTARYSRQYIRRLVTRILITVLLILGFTFGLWYSLLGNYEYVESVGQQLVIRHGHPGYNAFGFPKTLWETELPTAALASQGGQDVAYIQSALGVEVTPALIERLKPGYRELALHWLGRDNEARASLRQLFNRELLPDQEMVGATAQLLGELATAEDIPTLEQLTAHPRSDVRLGGVRGLLRLSPAKVLTFLTQSKNAEDRELHRVVLENIPQGDSVTATQIIRLLLNANAYRSAQGPLFEAALRANVQLSPEEIMLAIERDMSAYPKDEAMYARLTGQENALAMLLQRKIIASPATTDLPKYLYCLGQLVKAGTTLDGRVYLNNQDAWVRRSAAYFCLQHHQIAFNALPQPLQTDVWVLTQLAGTEHLTSEIGVRALAQLDYEHINIGATRTLLDALLPVIDNAAVPYLLRLLHYNDPNDISGDVNLPAMQGLRLLHYDAREAVNFFNSESVEMAKEAYLWYAQEHRSEVIEKLFDRIDDEDADLVTEVFLDLDLTRAELDRFVQVLKSGNESARRRAAQILAGKAEIKTVVNLLSSPVRQIRNAGIEYVALNPGVDKILDSIRIDYPDPTAQALKNQLQTINEFRSMLANCPAEMRPWRLTLAKSTSKLSQGLERRVDEFEK
jgi:hypothetical protein